MNQSWEGSIDPWVANAYEVSTMPPNDPELSTILFTHFSATQDD